MTESILTISEISKRYGQQFALHQVNFSVDKGEICGLVGENGAGKTTLLRVLTGLIKPSAGQITYTQNLRQGALIESPALYPHLSAYDNLYYVGRQIGLSDLKNRVADILQLIGLADVPRKKKAKNFSLGMRQRLAIGLAILEYPEFLILDEPINGLDPVAIKEVRELILKLKKDYQMTILISSHILSELELVADKYVIMHKGEILEIDTPQRLSQQSQSTLYLATTDNQTVSQRLTERQIAHHLDQEYIVLEVDIRAMELIAIVQELDLDVLEVYKNKTNFENYYLNLIGGADK